MHEIEQHIVDAIKSGHQPSLKSLGGFERLANASQDLQTSRLMPEILSMLCREIEFQWPTDWRHFILNAMQAANHGPIIHECVDILDRHPAVAGDLANGLFGIYCTRAADGSVEPLARTAFLEGCIRLTISDAGNRFRLIDVLTRTDASGFSPFTKRFVKIVGVCNCHWPLPELLQVLLRYQSSDDCADEANLELGMHHFGRWLSASSGLDARQELSQAETYFRIAGEYATVHAEATLYRLACRIVRDFSEGELSNSAQLIAEEISHSVAALRAYHRTADDPPWLGARTTEIILWEELGQRLRSVDIEIDSDGWFDPREIIETGLIPIFNASRSLLKRNEVGGVEALIQPRLVGSIANNRSHIANLRQWLHRNPDSPIASEVSKLIGHVETELVSSNSSTVVFSRIQRGKLSGFLDHVSSQDESRKLISQVIDDAMSLHLRNLNAVQLRVLIECVEGVKDHPDYKSPDVRLIFNTTLLWLLQFTASRLDMMKGDAPEIEYLFRSSDGERAKEDKLQNDFMAWFRPFAVGSQIEVTNVGGGRADVFLRCNAERMVVEVKREHRICSFDALEKNYSAQTFQYQNTASRLGFLLVLDQTDREGQALHLANSIRLMHLTPKDETEPRSVVVCIISGDRCTPSDLSKSSKRGKRG